MKTNDTTQLSTPGDRLKMIAQEIFGSVTRMAQYLDISQSGVSQYTSGQRAIGEKLIKKLETLGINSSFILTGYGSMFSANVLGNTLAEKYSYEMNLAKETGLEPPNSIFEDNFILPMMSLKDGNMNTHEKTDIITPFFETRGMFGSKPEISMIPEIVVTVRAGTPTIYLEDDIRGYTNMRGTFIAKISGDSMVGLGLHDGDELIMVRGNSMKTDDIIIARIGDSFTLKQVSNGKGYILLNPANPEYEPIIITPENAADFECMGIYTGFKRSKNKTMIILIYLFALLLYTQQQPDTLQTKIDTVKTGNVIYNVSSTQCKGTTKKGNRCKRLTKDKSGYCWQHKK